jgi:hypothetical protein
MTHRANLNTTTYCVTETLTVFKRKFQQKKITRDAYIEYVETFIGRYIGWNLHIEDEIGILDPVLWKQSASSGSTTSISSTACRS